MDNFDLIVIGGGPGGYVCAIRAAQLGLKTACVESRGALGGTCLNVGCIPSKSLLNLSENFHKAKKDFNQQGIEIEGIKLNIEKMMSNKNKSIQVLTKGVEFLFKKNKVTYLKGKGVIFSKNDVVVYDNNKKTNYKTKNIVIATGSEVASLPGIKIDEKNIISSTGALSLKKVPEKLAVIGGGYIGLEMGTVFSALGSSVSVAEFLPNLLPGADPDLVKPLARKLKKEFSEIHLSTKITKVEQAKSGAMDVTMEKNGEETTKQYEQVLVSVGRKPNTEKMGVDKTNIKVNEQGFISVDKYQQTSVKNIFAIGDIVGNPMLAHKATHEGKVAAEVICGLPAAFDAKAIPAVIFTDPEIAWVGITETEAKESGIAYEKGEFPWAASGKSLALGRNEGRTKILFDKDTKRTIGVGIVGPNAGDLISEGALAIEMGADAEDISLTVHPHPTLGETFANAAEVFEGTVTDLYIPKKTR